MIPGDDAIESLRAAVRVSPDNIPLRLHLASSLAGLARYDEAENELKQALSLAPQDANVKLALARVYMQQDKTSQAMVVVEDVINQGNPPATAYVNYARLLIREGDIPNAVAQYKLGLENDPDVADDELNQRLGVNPVDDESEVFEGRVRQAAEDSGGSGFDPDLLERPDITFKHVGGMEKLKEEIRIKIIHPLNHSDLYKAYGKTVGGGLLMYGPPGCGKTYLARATAGEIDANFISIGINQVLDMWTGNSERNLHELFEQARFNKPCVVFFDEVDALGGRRSDMASASGRHLINQFLSEMDGIQSSNEGVLILAATNAPWHIDPAFRRPGRFDKVLFVPPPDGPARAEILRIHCQEKPCGDIDFHQVNKKTEQFSGADLKAIVDVAVEAKLTQAIKTGRPEPLETKDLLKASKSLKPTTREWFSTAKNYATFANQGGIYDDVVKYLKL